MFKILVFVILIGGCVCPDAAYLAGRRTRNANWEHSSYGNVPNDEKTEIGLVSRDRKDGKPQYVCRANTQYWGVLPGKMDSSEGNCYVSWGEKEFGYQQYQVLVNRDSYDYEWASDSDGRLPHGSILGGYRNDGVPLFICRADIDGKFEAGKLEPFHNGGACFIPYGGLKS